MVLLLLIHLLTLQASGTVGWRKDTDVSSVERNPGDIILEEVIISDSGNGTRVVANAIVEDPSGIGDGILSLLSKREIRRRRSQETSSSGLDESRTVIVNVHDEDDLERLRRAMAEYEPRRIASGKAKRRIADAPNDDAHGVREANGGAAGSDLERIYHEVLRNISRGVPRSLLTYDANVTPSPYLSQTMRNLQHAYVPQATVHATSGDGRAGTYPSVHFSHAPPTLKKKKTELLEKYLQINRTVVPPRVLSIGELKLDGTADGKESTALRKYFKVPSGKAYSRAKNESLPESSSSTRPDSTGKLEDHQWNAREYSSQVVSPSVLKPNDDSAYDTFNSNGERRSNLPSGSDASRTSSKYSRVPQPFAVSQLPSATAASIETSYGRPSSSPASIGGQPQALRSSGNVLPLALPTDLFKPPTARYYVPTKRVNYFDSGGNPATLVEASSPASVTRRRINLENKPDADYAAPHGNVIDGARTPAVVANGHRSSGSPYYYIVKPAAPAARVAARANPVLTYVAGRAPASYVPRRPSDPRVKQAFLHRVATHGGPDGGRPDLSANPGFALYDRFASSRTAGAPAPVARDQQDPKQPTSPSRAAISGQVFASPRATPPPVSSGIRPRPLAPYYDSELHVSHNTGEEELKGDKENVEGSVETNEQPRAKDATESEEEVADGKSALGNNVTRTDHGTSKAHETSSEWREKEGDEDGDEDRYERPDYAYKDGRYGGHDENEGKGGERENVRYGADEDEEDADATREDEHVRSEEDEGSREHLRQSDERGYDRDNSEEERREEGRPYGSKRHDEEENHRGKLDRDADATYKFLSNYKYPYSSRYKDYKDRAGNEEEFRDRYDRRKSESDDRHEEDRKREDSEGESVDEDKPVGRRSKDQRGQRERHEKKRNNDGDTARKDHRHRAIEHPRHEKRKYEEYGETSPEHVRQGYHHRRQQRPRGTSDHRDHRRGDGEGYQNSDNKEVHDHVHGETQEHAQKHEEHHEGKKDGGDYKFEEGGSGEKKEEHHEDEEEKGHKGYKVWHEHEKAEKGHHDKEHANKEFDEKDGEEKKHEEEGGYHEKYQHGEKGEKAAEFGEKGEHQKGHSTKGEHSVHKKDEYEKKTEFFNEFHEDDGAEKHGAHHHDYESKKGGHGKKGHHDAADHEEKYGEEKKYEKGGHHHEHKGHKIDEGHDHHYDHDEKYGKKEGREHGKKWSFKKGDDGESANAGHKHDR